MIKTVGFCIRQDHLSHDEFVEHFRQAHVELGKELPGLIKYTTSVPTQQPGELKHRDGGSRDVSVPEAGLVEYDIISELWFEDLEAFNNAFPSEASRKAFEDEEEFFKEIYFVVVDEEVHLDES
ncbi:MAG: EthD domain-containing protein [Halobacteriota archaeon]